VKNWLESDSQSMPPGASPFFFSQHFSVDSVQVELGLLLVLKANKRPEPIISAVATNMMFFFFMSLDFARTGLVNGF